MITAHTGSDGTLDNSFEFVKYALSIGVNAFEVDVHRRADGVLVIAHDDDLQKQYKNQPTLYEVCLIASKRADLGINYDCKDDDIELEVCALHQKLCPRNPIFLSGTISVNTYESNREKFGKAKILLNTENVITGFYQRMRMGEYEECADELVQICNHYDIRTVNVSHWYCPDEFLNVLWKNGINVSVWTIDSLEIAKHFLARQVFNITTKRPVSILSLLGLFETEVI